MTQILNETKRWVDIIESLSNENKRMTLEMMTFKNHPKLGKMKTLRLNEYEEPIQRREREVYSEGNVVKERNMIDDFSPF